MSKPQRLGARRTISTTLDPTPAEAPERQHAADGESTASSTIGPQPVEESATAATPAPTTEESSDSQRTTSRRSRKQTNKASSEPSGGRRPVGYDQLEDVHVRLRDDQVELLDRERRRLVRQSRRTRDTETEYERITANTLVRVAVDALAARVDELDGHTEADLRQSLGLPQRTPRSAG